MSGFDVRGRARPVLKWVGGKSGPLTQLTGLFPEKFERFLEPFLGGGAVFLALRPGIPALIGDHNRELVELYEVVRDDPGALTAALDAHAALYSEAHYYALRAESPTDRVARAARTIFLNKTGYNGLYRLNGQGIFNVPFGKRPRCPTLYDAQNIRRVSARLKEASLLCGAFETILAEAGPGDFVYCDPPYEPLSRTSAFTSYTAAGFSQDDQKRLEDLCSQAAARGARVAVSNSHAPFILSLYSQWDVKRIRVRRAVNSKVTHRGEIDEILAVKL